MRKRMLAVMIALLLSFTPLVLISQDAGTKYAKDLFVPIACTGPDFGFKAMVGTGFPVREHLIMTAKHVDCGPANILEISNDGGTTWELIPRDHQYVSAEHDIRVLESKQSFVPSKFRKAVLGEKVFGFGSAAGVIATFGNVMKITESYVRATNIPVGGMSGSALVADDGQVVGMVVLAVPVFVAGFPSAWITEAISASILEDFLAHPMPTEDVSKTPSEDRPLANPNDPAVHRGVPQLN